MSKDNDSMLFPNFDARHGWGIARQDSPWTPAGHGALAHKSNPRTQIRRSDKNNAWQSVRLPRVREAAAE